MDTEMTNSLLRTAGLTTEIDHQTTSKMVPQNQGKLTPFKNKDSEERQGYNGECVVCLARCHVLYKEKETRKRKEEKSKG